MPNNRRRPFSVIKLIRRLMTDAIAWSNDEMALTKVDAKFLLRRYVVGFSFMLVSFAVLIAAVFTLAQTVIGALAEYLHGHIIAGLTVSLILFVLTFGLIASARYFFLHKAHPKGIVFQRIMGGTPESES